MKSQGTRPGGALHEEHRGIPYAIYMVFPDSGIGLFPIRNSYASAMLIFKDVLTCPLILPEGGKARWEGSDGSRNPPTLFFRPARAIRSNGRRVQRLALSRREAA